MSLIQRIGKGLENAGRAIGKGVTNTVKTIGKGVMSVAKPISGALEAGLGFVKDVASKADSALPSWITAPVKASPLFKEAQAIFSSAEDLSKGLKEAIALGDEVLDFNDDVSSMLSKKNISSDDVAKILKRGQDVGASIAKKDIVKKASKMPTVQKSLKKYNELVKRIEKHPSVSKEQVQKLKKMVRA